MKHQQIVITLPAETLARIESANPDESRTAERAVALIRLAVSELFPPRTTDEWRDGTRYQGVRGHLVSVLHDLARDLPREWARKSPRQRQHSTGAARQSYPLTLRVPDGLMAWVEEIARRRRTGVPEAAAYAVEYGSQVLASQGGPEEVDRKLRQTWRDIWRALWVRS